MTPNPTNTIPVISAAVFDKDGDLVEFDCIPPNVLSEIPSVHHQIFADHPTAAVLGKIRSVRRPSECELAGNDLGEALRTPSPARRPHQVHPRPSFVVEIKSSLSKLSKSIVFSPTLPFHLPTFTPPTNHGHRPSIHTCTLSVVSAENRNSDGVVYSQAIHVEGVRTTCKEAGKRRGRGGRESKGRGEGCPTASGCMDYRRVQRTGHEFASQPHIQLSFGC